MKKFKKEMKNDLKSKQTRKFLDKIEDIDKYLETPWLIVESYFKGQHLKQLVRHQIESYNDFVNYQIQKTIDMFNPVVVHSDHDYNKRV